MHKMLIEFKRYFKGTDAYVYLLEKYQPARVFEFHANKFRVVTVQAAWEVWQRFNAGEVHDRTKRLRELKAANGWTVYQIAEITDAKTSTVCAWLTVNTKRPIPHKKLQDLEDAHKHGKTD